MEYLLLYCLVQVSLFFTKIIDIEQLLETCDSRVQKATTSANLALHDIVSIALQDNLMVTSSMMDTIFPILTTTSLEIISYPISHV